MSWHFRFCIVRLACLYYDRMMLTAAEERLTVCKALSKVRVELGKNKQSSCLAALSSKEYDAQLPKSSRRAVSELIDTPRFDYETLHRAEDRLEKIIQDIAHVKELQTVYCTTTGSTKILPCIGSRFFDSCTDCDNWWTAIRGSPLLFWSSSN